MSKSALRPVTPTDLRNDALIAVGLLIAAVLSSALMATAGVYGENVAPMSWSLVYSAAVTLPLALRRRYPSIAAIVIACAFFAGGSLRVPELYVGNIAMFISIFTVGAWLTNRRRALYVRGAIIAGMFVWLTVATYLQAVEPGDDALSQVGAFSPFLAWVMLQFLVNAAYFAGAYYLGDRTYASALERDELARRGIELEHERERNAAQAVALDRVRIARELHDVVAHHVSAMGVQAAAARAVLATNPDAASRTLAGVEESARQAIDELHEVLETLRTPTPGTGLVGDDERASPPAPELPEASTIRFQSGIEDLVAHANANGLPTSLTTVGAPIEAAPVTQVNLYRIAQEALTNARRHGGPNARADVRVRYLDDDIEVEVGNTGRPPRIERAGLGLVGMRERAAISGGELHVGPRERGGFLVRVRVPGAPLPSAVSA